MGFSVSANSAPKRCHASHKRHTSGATHSFLPQAVLPQAVPPIASVPETVRTVTAPAKQNASTVARAFCEHCAATIVAARIAAVSEVFTRLAAAASTNQK